MLSAVADEVGNLGNYQETDCKENFHKPSQKTECSAECCLPEIPHHNIKPFTFCCSKWATPARQNKF